MPTFSIKHVTRYRYRQAVALGEHRLMLRPREGYDQHTLRAEIAITPRPTHLSWSEDASGNLVGLCRFGQRVRELTFASNLLVEQTTLEASESAISDHARTCPFSYGSEDMPDLARFVERQHPDPGHALDAWVRGILRSCAPAAGGRTATWAFLTRVNDAIWRDFAYMRRDEKGIQQPVETLRRGQGTCRDFAVLMCEAVRSQGLAARFVSGYLCVRRQEGARRAGGSTHAWLQVFLPGAGWVDFDPTSGRCGNDDLVRVATVRDPSRAIPLSGSFMGFPSDFNEMTVEVQMSEMQMSAADRSALGRLATDGTQVHSFRDDTHPIEAASPGRSRSAALARSL